MIRTPSSRKNIAELVADDDGDAADAAIAHHHPGNVQVHLQRGGWAGVDCQLAEGGGGAVGDASRWTATQ